MHTQGKKIRYQRAEKHGAGQYSLQNMTVEKNPKLIKNKES